MHSLPELIPNVDVQDPNYDIVVIVTDNLDRLTGNLESLKVPIQQYAQVM